MYDNIDLMQKACISGTAKIIRRVLDGFGLMSEPFEPPIRTDRCEEKTIIVIIIAIIIIMVPNSPLPIKCPNGLRQIKPLTNKSISWPSRGGTVLTNRRTAKGRFLALKNQ